MLTAICSDSHIENCKNQGHIGDMMKGNIILTIKFCYFRHSSMNMWLTLGTDGHHGLLRQSFCHFQLSFDR